MSATASVTATDFWTSLRRSVRLVYEEIVVVSIASMGASLLALPIVTIGPACLAAVATVTDAAERRGSERTRSDRAQARVFLGAFREHFRAGIPFSALIGTSALISSVYLLLAAANGSTLFWFGAALGLYTTLAAVALTFRAGSVIVRAGDNPPGAGEAVRRGADVWLLAPGYSALHLLAAGLLQVALALVTPAAIVLLAGSLAVLEVVAYEDLVGGGSGSLFE